MEEDILYTTMDNNVGQYKVEDADMEIKRLNHETRNWDGKWVKDFSPKMFVIDEIEENVCNPTILCEGHCWIVFHHNIRKKS